MDINKDDKNFKKWFNPIIVSLRSLGGEASPLSVRKKLLKLNT